MSEGENGAVAKPTKSAEGFTGGTSKLGVQWKTSGDRPSLNRGAKYTGDFVAQVAASSSILQNTSQQQPTKQPMERVSAEGETCSPCGQYQLVSSLKLLLLALPQEPERLSLQPVPLQRGGEKCP